MRIFQRGMGALSSVCTLGKLIKKNKSGKVKTGRRKPNGDIAHKCKIGRHADCTSMACKCPCGHGGK